MNESTKRNAWLSLRDTSPWRATNSEECDVVWRNRYFCFLTRFASLLLKTWCTMMDLGDTSRPAMDSSDQSEAHYICGPNHVFCEIHGFENDVLHKIECTFDDVSFLISIEIHIYNKTPK